MRPLVRPVLLLVLLDPAFLLTQDDRGLPTGAPIPGLSIHFDPRGMDLTWECRENITSVLCAMVTPETGQVAKRPKPDQCHCSFRNDGLLHGGATLQVTVRSRQEEVTETLVYTNPGGEGTMAQNVSCFVYDADFMNCTWARGPEAPKDVQYFLSIRDLKTQRERECPHYVQDSGTHVGCHLEGLAGFGPSIYILVNGTSPKTRIRFFDAIFMLKQIEIYSPPNGIRVECNASHCLVCWQPPRTRVQLSDWEFKYQLGIGRRNNMQHGSHQPVEVSGDSENTYSFPSPLPRARHTVRVRAADSRILHWGPWSQPVEFGSGDGGSSLVPVYVLVVLGTVAGVLVLSCFCKRFIEMPIPHIKKTWSDHYLSEDDIIWEKVAPGAWKGDHEEVFTVEEVGEATAKM